MMKKLLFFILIYNLSWADAQVQLSLQQCIDSALAAHNGIRQSALLMETARVALKQARSNILPAVGMDISHGLNAGRSIDPFTNTYVNQSINRAGYGIGADVVLFNGGSLQNRIRENASAYEASRMDWQLTKDQVVLNVILSYLQVLSNEDQLGLARQQGKASKNALDRLTILDTKGAIRPSDVTDLKGQLMNDELMVINAHTQLETSKLQLLQWMNRPYDSAIRLERVNMEALLTSYEGTSATVYETALNQFSLVKAAALRKNSARYGLKAARGQLFPTISLGAGLNTNYSSLARDASQEKISYGSQLKNNRFSAIGIGVSIPIFNRNIARNRIKDSEIMLESMTVAEQETKRLLRQQVDEAYINMINAYQRYIVLQEQVKAYRESFKAAEARFTAGVGTSIDFLAAKDRMEAAEVNLVTAQYDFVLRKKVLDFYAGKF